MKKRTVRAVLLIVSLLLLIGCTACTSQEDESLSALVNTLTKERRELQQKLETVEGELDRAQTELSAAKADANAAHAELDRMKAAPEATPVVVTETKEVVKEVPATGAYAVGVGCTVNGGMTAQLNGATSVRCVPNTVEGYAFDHWEVDGVRQDTTEKTLELTVSETTVIRAVFHERHILKCINCHFQFINDNGNATGKTYTEYDFEESYKNPVTKKKVEGGLISFYIFADIPNRQQVDYWLINGVKYQFPNNTVKFRVVDLDEATVYEVVFKNQSRRQTPVPGYRTPVPTFGRQPASTPGPAFPS